MSTMTPREATHHTDDGTPSLTTTHRQRIDDWLDALARETDQARKAAAFTAYLTAMSRFWRYSQANSQLIYMQRPTATHVNSRKRWDGLGYTVQKGAWKQGIGILCPHFRKERDRQTGEETQVLTHFSTGYIYDVADMVAGPNAQPLVAPWQTLSGDHEALYALLLETCHRLRITVTLDLTLPEAIKGSSTGKGQIRLRAQEGMGERALTLLHEMAHETLHPSAVREQAGFTRQQVECQAEAVAYCCAQALGMETPNSPTYLALYHIGRDELRKNAQAIAVGVQKILRAVERASEPAAAAAA